MKTIYLKTLLLTALLVSGNAQAFDIKFLHENEMVSLNTEYLHGNSSAMMSFYDHLAGKEKISSGQLETTHVCMQTDTELEDPATELNRMAGSWNRMLFQDNTLEIQPEVSDSALLMLISRENNSPAGQVSIRNCETF